MARKAARGRSARPIDELIAALTVDKLREVVPSGRQEWARHLTRAVSCRGRWGARRRVSGPSQPLDAFEIVAALARHRVDHVVIGGVALQARGHVRTTVDLDVIAARTPENLRRLGDPDTLCPARRQPRMQRAIAVDTRGKNTGVTAR